MEYRAALAMNGRVAVTMVFVCVAAAISACNTPEQSPLAPVATIPPSRRDKATATASAVPPPVAPLKPADDAHRMPMLHAAGLGQPAKIDASLLSGKVGVVAFWATYAFPCQKMMPALDQLRARYGARGFEVIGISEDESTDAPQARAFLGTLSIQFPNGIDDEDRHVGQAWRLSAMPCYFLVDREGVVRFTHLGWHDGEEQELERQIADLL
jgi:thiol-disulfide isomerase/thioredoxin